MTPPPAAGGGDKVRLHQQVEEEVQEEEGVCEEVCEDVKEEVEEVEEVCEEVKVQPGSCGSRCHQRSTELLAAADRRRRYSRGPDSPDQSESSVTTAR